MMYRNTFILALLTFNSVSQATTWQVGTGLTYTLPSQVSTLVANGDTVDIAAGIYPSDVAAWAADDLLLNESTFEKVEVLETLQNYSDPKTHLIPRLIRAIGDGGTQLTLITGPGRIFPFLRTHTILESLQPAMLRHPVIIFFPGKYDQAASGGSHLRLFGEIPSPLINNPYYRATNLDYYKL